MSYWRYWNLNAAPFAEGDRDSFYRGQSVEEALARIEFVCGQRRKLATLVAGSGVGKTRLLNYLVANPPRESDEPQPRVISLSMIGLQQGELAERLASRLSGTRLPRRSQAWSTLTDCFATSARGSGHTLLLVDDVESSSVEAEADLIRIVRAADEARLSVVLAIDSHLASTVSRWLIERSYLQVELPAWDYHQTNHFLHYALARCGRSEPLFTEAAVVRLQELSRGAARRIVQLADLALIGGAVGQAKWIDEQIVLQVAQELPKSLSIAA